MNKNGTWLTVTNEISKVLLILCCWETISGWMGQWQEANSEKKRKFG
jgi:hypothetical protein